MATEVTYNGDGSSVTFNITFPFLQSADVKVQVDGTTVNTPTDYSVTGNVVEFVTAPPTGTSNVRLYRNTDKTTPAITYSAGSAIKADDLNKNHLQTLYSLQEIGTVTANDSGLGLTSGSKGDIQVVSGTDWYIKTDAVESNMLATDSVTSDAIAANAVGVSELNSSINTTLNAVSNKADIGGNISLFTNDTGFITQSQVPTSFVTGMILMYTGTTAPTGWALCDGTNGTPDLRDRFIVGSGNTYSVGNTGGANSVNLNVNEIPSHSHSYVGHTYPGSGPEQNQAGGPEDRTSFNVNKTTGTTGSGQAHENRPPYYALCFIVKI